MLDVKLDVHGSAILANELSKDIIITGIVQLEGGYVNHVDDLGGETNFGITKKVANSNAATLKSKFNWNGRMRDLTLVMAKYIYEKDYWMRNKLDSIFDLSPCIADKLFDVAVNMGASRGIKWLQEALNVLNRRERDYKDIKADGIMGTNTINALKAFLAKRGLKDGTWVLLRIITAKQITHYVDISNVNESNESFMFGWMDRAEYNQNLYRRALGK